jgi:hypothetical protein
MTGNKDKIPSSVTTWEVVTGPKGEAKGVRPFSPYRLAAGAAIHLPHSSLRELRGGKDKVGIDGEKGK